MRQITKHLTKRLLIASILIIGISAGLAATLTAIQNRHLSTTKTISEATSQPGETAGPKSGRDNFALPGGIPLSERLQQKNPFTILIVGDYNNEPTQEDWVYKFAEHISDAYHRLSVMHYWSKDASAYTSQISIGDPALPLTEIWVGSTGQVRAADAVSKFQSLAPQRPDIAIVNFGFYEEGYPEARQSIELLESKIKTSWVNPPAMAIVLQNPRIDTKDLTTRQFRITSGLRTQYGAPRKDVRIIDVFEAFRETAGTAELVNEDGYTPNQRGNNLWTETVKKALGISN